MTDRLKIVRIRARNVPRTRTQALRRRLVSRISLTSKKRLCRMLMCRGSVLLKHKKIVCEQPAHVWQWPPSKKVVATV